MSFILLGILNAQAEAGAVGSYDLLETTILTSDTASVEFTGLGSYSDYKHLQIRLLTRTDGNNNMRLQWNGVTASNYATHRIERNDSGGVDADAFLNVGHVWANRPTASGDPAGAFAANIFDFLDFNSTTKNKTVRMFGGAPAPLEDITLRSGFYPSTDAITSIKILTQTNNFITGSRFSLYGIKAA